MDLITHTQMLQSEVNVDRTWVLLFVSEASPVARGHALSLESAGAEGRSQSGAWAWVGVTVLGLPPRGHGNGGKWVDPMHTLDLEVTGLNQWGKIQGRKKTTIKNYLDLWLLWHGEWWEDQLISALVQSIQLGLTGGITKRQISTQCPNRKF